MPLRWKDARPEFEMAEIVGGTCVKPGKPVWLFGDGYATPPENFHVYHRLGFVLRAYQTRKRRPTVVPVGQPQPVKQDSDGGLQAGPILLRTPGRRVKWRLFFTDGAESESEELHVSRLGTFSPPEGTVAGTGLRLPMVFTAAIDPDVQLSVLAPWDADDWNSYLRELVEGIRDESESLDDAVASLKEYLGDYLPQEQPADWNFHFDEDRFTLAENEAASFTLTLDMLTPGGTAFAVQATGEVDGETVQVLSEPLIARMPDDGQAAELFGGDEGGGDSGEDLPPAPRRTIAPANAETAPKPSSTTA